MTSFRIVVSLAISLCVWRVAFTSFAAASIGDVEYAGSTPCDDASRAFVGGIASNVPCHTITWHLTFSTKLNANQRATYRLRAQYGLQGKTDPNQLEEGPVVESSGEWEIVPANEPGSLRVVYRLSAAGGQKTVSLKRIGENLLHFLSPDKSLRIGNAGWSYTLNRKDVFAVTPLSTEVIEPVVGKASGSTNFWREAARQGPQIHGYFEGRSPCQEIAKLLNVPKGDACIKIKWQLILYEDPATHAPTSYALGGLAWRNPPKTGKWTLSKGTKEDPAAVVYQLDPDKGEGFLSFQKADDNILLFLGNDRELLVGNEKFSYTLNRFQARSDAFTENSHKPGESGSAH
jgi:hypothetical protein